MPTYQYRCNDCGHDLEVVQKFSDPSLTECPTCEGELRKVFNAVGVVFKGSGFYSTDNHTKGASKAATAESSTSRFLLDEVRVVLVIPVDDEDC